MHSLILLFRFPFRYFFYQLTNCTGTSISRVWQCSNNIGIIQRILFIFNNTTRDNLFFPNRILAFRFYLIGLSIVVVVFSITPELGVHLAGSFSSWTFDVVRIHLIVIILPINIIRDMNLSGSSPTLNYPPKNISENTSENENGGTYLKIKMMLFHSNSQKVFLTSFLTSLTFTTFSMLTVVLPSIFVLPS